jgi:hypothetical protein
MTDATQSAPQSDVPVETFPGFTPDPTTVQTPEPVPVPVGPGEVFTPDAGAVPPNPTPPEGEATFAAPTEPVEAPTEAVFSGVPVQAVSGDQLPTALPVVKAPTLDQGSPSITGDVETLIREIHADVKQLLATFTQLGAAVAPVADAVQKEGLSGLVKALLKSI